MEGKKIYEAIPKVMADVGAVGKNNKNTQQNFMYRGIDAVMNALQPAMIKNKVFVVPTVLNEERTERVNKNGVLLFYTRLTVSYNFYAEDGSFINAVVVGEAMDSGDKATNKAMSIAYKYACFQVFCIPTEEMKDPDAECHEVKAKEQPVQTSAVIKCTPTDINALKVKMQKCGVPDKTVLDRYKLKSFEDMTFAQFNNAMGILNAMPEEG